MDSPIVDGKFRTDNTQAPPSTGSVLDLFSLKGKTAIVAGAGAGIGLAVSHAFAEAGANIAIWYNSNKATIERAAEIEKKYGVQCRAYQVNVTDPEKVSDAISTVVQEFNGRLDIFIANSGVPWTKGAMIDADLDHYRKVIRTDVDGVYYCARAAAAHWRRQKEKGTDINGKKLENFTYGSFIATASMSAHVVNYPQLQTAYNAAKAAVIQMCKSLAVEWVRFARANSVSPGYIATELSDFIPAATKAIWHEKIPMGREGETHELVGAYLYLASNASSYTTGTDIIVDGGYVLP
ncbi:L-xylulose reductase [Histoplasma capsulatum]|uniref:L-xylulose reductase n=1 Tax=Ajellomyces capsulatus TaxID=5037 RepID=A0A8A1LYR5_AJECA|nr:sorbitol utilization protein SOU1 [Histoplasma mississippiense (nom. inval.)]EDN02762.1 sorbitol utilization protein SOU1 [Histoplasma mississippiense (nom. inval.)]QSS58350.1 L-xylulose reductase [Histoplasma capsulatum]